MELSLIIVGVLYRWTRSNWAFLNEPPHEDVNKSSYKYVSQFHVAEATKKKLKSSK